MEVYWFTVACDRVGCIIYSISYQANGKLCICMVVRPVLAVNQLPVIPSLHG